MKIFIYLLSGFAFSSCTKKPELIAPKVREEEVLPLSLAAKTEEQDPRPKLVETVFESYKQSHIEKSLVNLKNIYQGDFSVKASWKGNAQTSEQWRANRKKFMNPIKSVEFSDTVIFKKPSRNIYAVVFKETVVTYDKKSTVYYGYLESAPADDSHFAVEQISLAEADFDRWMKDRN